MPTDASTLKTIDLFSDLEPDEWEKTAPLMHPVHERGQTIGCPKDIL